MTADRKSRGRARLAAEALEARQLLAFITVNSAGDADGADSSSTLSLRQAIEVSNGTLPLSSLSIFQAGLVAGPLATPNEIDFAISGVGPVVIEPASELPTITSPVIINGYSQASSHPNTNGPGLGDDAVLRVDLSGSLMPTSANPSGLDLAGGGCIVEGLAIGGFTSGIVVTGPGNVVRGDFIGTDVSGTSGFGNVDGLDVVGGPAMIASPATIGGTLAADRNILSGNAMAGINGVGLIEGNLIGLDATGSRALPNGTDGIEGAGTIGGITPAARNVISGNGEDGIIDELGELIEGNYIGTDVTGTRSIPNAGDGILSGNPGYPNVDAFPGLDTIGGTTPGAGNVISGNGGVGIDLDGGNSPAFDYPVALVEGNLIGLDATGSRPLGNARGGIDGSATATIAGNVISGNLGIGLILDEGLVQGNVIGLDATRTKPIANVGDGVEAFGGVTIGGTAPGAGNLVSSNLGAGIFLDGPRELAEGNVLLANGGAGVSVDGSSDTIGGTTPGAPNVIAANRGAGVSIALAYEIVSGDPEGPTVYTQDPASGRFDTVSVNAIFGNLGLGIDLLDAARSYALRPDPTPRDVLQVNPGDLPGANGLPPAPTLQFAAAGATGTVDSGTLAGAPSTTFLVEFFGDPTGNGQGKIDLGSIFATTDAAGLASITFASPIPMAGQSITASATDPSGNTSEFAQPVLVKIPTTTTLAGPSGLVLSGQPATFTAVAQSPGAEPTGLVAFAEAGVLLGLEPVDASGIATFTTTQLTPGNHVLQAAYLGDASTLASVSGLATVGILPAVAQAGPTVISLVSNNLKSITITFSRSLAIGPAQDIQNYAIIDPDGKAVAIESATDDPQDDSVTLTTRLALKPDHKYRVTIDGERVGRVVDSNGVPLSGKPGHRPGTSFAGAVATGKAARPPKHPASKKSSHPSKP